MTPALDAVSTAALWRALLATQRLSRDQGVASHAAIDDGEPELARLLAREAVARADADGQLGALGDDALVDSGTLLEATMLLAGDGDPVAAAAAERERWWLLRYSPRDDSGVVHHRHGSREVWADSVYTVVPALVATGDVAPADMQYRMHREHLWHASTGLYGHRFDLAAGAFIRPRPWAAGTGWVASGLARALAIGVEAEAVRDRWRHETRALLDACAVHERDDGRFHDTLDDPSSFVDGGAGLMFAYAAFTGVADRWLPETYAEHAERWAAASLARVDRLGVVREVGGAPTFDRPGSSATAQAFAILALAARRRIH